MSTQYPQTRATARQPEGTCYRVLMWEACALSAEQLAAWQGERKRLLAEMRDAGIKGARGKLATLETQLNELNIKHIEHPLTLIPRAAFSFARVDALAACLCEDAAVLAYRMGSAAAEVLVELTGTESPDAMAARWQPNSNRSRMTERLAPRA